MSYYMCTVSCLLIVFFLTRRRPPRSTLTDTSFPTRRSSDLVLLEERGIRCIKAALTAENYCELLTPLLTAGEGQGFCVNLSIDVSSLDVMKLCRSLGVLYIDTVVEPWLGFYLDETVEAAQRTNYALRDTVRQETERSRSEARRVGEEGCSTG